MNKENKQNEKLLRSFHRRGWKNVRSLLKKVDTGRLLESEDKNIIIDLDRPLFEQGEIVISSLDSILVMVTKLLNDNQETFRGVVIWESTPVYGIGNSHMTWYKSSFKKTNFKILI